MSNTTMLRTRNVRGQDAAKDLQGSKASTNGQNGHHDDLDPEVVDWMRKHPEKAAWFKDHSDWLENNFNWLSSSQLGQDALREGLVQTPKQRARLTAVRKLEEAHRAACVEMAPEMKQLVRDYLGDPIDAKGRVTTDGYIRTHVAHAAMKLPGMLKVLENLTAAFLAPDIDAIGLEGVSGTGKTGGFRKMIIDSIVVDPSKVLVLDGSQNTDKDELVGFRDYRTGGQIEVGDLRPDYEVIFVDELTRLHPNKQSLFLKIVEEKCIRIGAETIELNPDMRFIFAFNGTKDMGAFPMAPALKDRLSVIIQYNPVSDEAIRLRKWLKTLNAGESGWDKTVGLPDKIVQGTTALNKVRKLIANKAVPEILVVEAAEADVQSHQNDLWDGGTQLSARSDLLPSLTNTLRLVRGLSEDSIYNESTRAELVEEVLYHATYSQLVVDGDQQDDKPEVWRKFLDNIRMSVRTEVTRRLEFVAAQEAAKAAGRSWGFTRKAR